MWSFLIQTMLSLFYGFFLFSWICVVVAASLTNISEGFCEVELVNLTLTTDCDFSGIEVSIHVNKTNFSDLILQCNNETCIVDGETPLEYALITNQKLDVSFPFRNREHGGKYINFRTTCQNQTSHADHAFLKPCRKWMIIAIKNLYYM